MRLIYPFLVLLFLCSPAYAIKYDVDPSSFSISINDIEVAKPLLQQRRVENLTETGGAVSWEYPDEKIAVTIKQNDDYLHVSIKSKTDSDNTFTWPKIYGDTYYMPLGDGKRILEKDNHLKGKELNLLEEFSMPFWITVSGDSAVMFIVENIYRNYITFDESAGFVMSHLYPAIDPERTNSFRIYVTDGPVPAAKIYRRCVIENGNFVTLEQKAEDNENIRKLYGAPHIYLWGENLISHDDIKWAAFRKHIGAIKRLADFKIETSGEFSKVLDAISKQDYVDNFQKNAVCRFLSEMLRLENFHEAFPSTDKIDVKKLDAAALIALNKRILSENIPVFRPVEQWFAKETVSLISELKAAGIDRAWIGLNSWEQAYAKPKLVEAELGNGYLIGPYDSYHSIHEPGKAKWITASFDDTSLYQNATVGDINGKKISGFQGVGRKLNPTLSMPSVKQRTNKIFSSRIQFNSWFIDCDATGEVHDDYSHITTQRDDLKARMERMAYIRDTHKTVIGSEGGNDFAASTIAFAHGIELKSFSWIDDDMKNNKKSKYYIGNYYNPTGGVAEHFSKRIPIKDEYYKIYVDPRHDFPLFRLVYNDSVITSYHWDWGTFKIKGAVRDRMLREILYNTPPLFHLDSSEWKRYKSDISAHVKVWSSFARRAVTQEMTDFRYLKDDGSVQLTEYGNDIAVVANFGNSTYPHDGKDIPRHSLLLKMKGEVSIYSPNINKDNS